MSIVRIGQIIESKVETEVEVALSGEKVIIPKGNKVIIGADGFAHHLRNGMIQPLGKDMEVKGYDAAGIAKYLYEKLNCHFEIDEMLENYDLDKCNFMSEIEYYLDDIGF